MGWGEGPYRSEIVVEVRCEISPSTGGIFTNREVEGPLAWEAGVIGNFMKIFSSER